MSKPRSQMKIYDHLFSITQDRGVDIMYKIIYDKWKKRRIDLLTPYQLEELITLLEKHYGITRSE